MDAVERAKSGHPGMPMGIADAATVLFTRFLKFDASDPAWPDRDRFVLSAGHGSMLLYALLHLTGNARTTRRELERFRRLGSLTPGHPERDLSLGIETTTGPLGQGFANGVGMALAERIMADRFGAEAVDHFTYVLASDGDLMEGVSHEAASLAGHLRLGKLIVLHDDNRISIDGSTDLVVSDDTSARFEACGWRVRSIDGHDPEAVAAAIEAARDEDRPSLIACRTVIAFGAPTKSGRAAAHGAPLGAEEIRGARDRLGWRQEPFELPDDVLAAWRAAGRRGAAARRAWTGRMARLAPDRRAEFDRVTAGRLRPGWRDSIRDAKRAAAAAAAKRATRQSSGDALAALGDAIPELIGGSADLSESNCTKPPSFGAIGAGDFSGRYLHYGVREHGMAATMNGMALHGGIIPYAGSFLIFTDYMRPAIRLSALMRQRVIYVMTHDSIGLGEDGPTHQPIEQLASLRAMPNLRVFRPADAVETMECWELALDNQTGPAVIALTRQQVPAIRRGRLDENPCARGGYVLEPANGATRVTLIATGSEVHVAVAARDRLQAGGVPTSVVSLPCWALFDAQPADYRASVLGDATLRVAVEAGARHGWERYIGPDGAFVGMTGFGASAPAGDLFEHFGITPAAVAEAALARLDEAERPAG